MVKYKNKILNVFPDESNRAKITEKEKLKT